MSEIHKSRNRIYGKKYSPEEYPAALQKAILAEVEKGDFSPESIGGKLGKHRSVISKAIHEYADRGLIQLTGTNRIVKVESQVKENAWRKMTMQEFVESSPEMKKWLEDISHRGKGGAPLKGVRSLVSYMKKICDVLKLNPSAFAVSRETNEKLLITLRDELKKMNPGLREGGWSRYAKALRNFSVSQGIGWDRNMAPTIASGKKANYGAYSSIYANDQQKEGIVSFARANFGSDLAMAIEIGHEVLCPRDVTLRNIKVGDIHFRQRNGFEIAEFEVYESKTDSIFPKQVLDPRVVKHLHEHVASKSPSSYLFGNGEPITMIDLAAALKKCYASVGIDVVSEGNEKLINYWKEKPIHVMRHTTATMWMRRSGMNPLLVGKQGWKDYNMVTQVYANMGLEEAWNANRCDFCKPDPNSTGDSHYCGWKCALSGLNQINGAIIA